MTDKAELLITALKKVRIPAYRGYLPGLHPELSRPAATVRVQKITEKETVFNVTVFAPAESGGALCENAAHAAMESIRLLGVQCIQESCRYDRSTGLLSVPLTVSWVPPAKGAPATAPACRVSVNGAELTGLTGVCVRRRVELAPVQEVGEGTVAVRWEKICWEITVEELLPPEAPVEALGPDQFRLTLQRAGGRELFPECRWVDVQRRDTPQGVQQVRIARTWLDRRIENAENGL